MAVCDRVYDGNTGKLIRTVQYRYDGDLLLAGETAVDADGGLLYTTEYARPEKGVTESFTYQDGKLYNTIRTESDDHDNTVYMLTRFYGDDGEESSRTEDFYTYVYNEDGSIHTKQSETRMVYLSGSKNQSSSDMECFYDPNGLLVKTVRHTFGQTYISEHLYDRYGNCVKIVEKRDGKEVSRYEYEYGYLMNGETLVP